jgi:hypothetical protein
MDGARVCTYLPKRFVGEKEAAAEGVDGGEHAGILLGDFGADDGEDVRRYDGAPSVHGSSLLPQSCVRRVCEGRRTKWFSKNFRNSQFTPPSSWRTERLSIIINFILTVLELEIINQRLVLRFN